MLPISLLLFVSAARGAIAEPTCETEEHYCPKHEHNVTDDKQCPNTCGNRLIPGQNASDTCDPFSGCVCDEGYVRPYDNATGACIPVCECPPIPKDCGDNEEPSSCMIICPPQTCYSIGIIFFCAHLKCKPGCNCKNGYLRDDQGVCIPSYDCPNGGKFDCMRHNATFTECPTRCPATCADPKANTKRCSRLCGPPGCECNPGYVLTETGGQCILPGDCPDECEKHNATFTECRTHCPATCADPDANTKPCIEICDPPGCQCNSGFVLTEVGGQCILPEDCPVDCEKHNATFTVCRTRCPATCADPHANNKPCSEICDTPGCQCKSGFVLTEAGGQCVLPEDCPVKTAAPESSLDTIRCSCPRNSWNTDDEVCDNPDCTCNDK